MLTQKAVINKLAEEHQLTKVEAGQILRELQEMVKDELRHGNPVTIFNFGTFRVSQHHARTGINPQTKEKLTIPAHKVVNFRTSNKFRDEL